MRLSSLVDPVGCMCTCRVLPISPWRDYSSRRSLCAQWPSAASLPALQDGTAIDCAHPWRASAVGLALISCRPVALPPEQPSPLGQVAVSSLAPVCPLLSLALIPPCPSCSAAQLPSCPAATRQPSHSCSSCRLRDPAVASAPACPCPLNGCSHPDSPLPSPSSLQLPTPVAGLAQVRSACIHCPGIDRLRCSCWPPQLASRTCCSYLSSTSGAAGILLFRRGRMCEHFIVKSLSFSVSQNRHLVPALDKLLLSTGWPSLLVLAQAAAATAQLPRRRRTRRLRRVLSLPLLARPRPRAPLVICIGKTVLFFVSQNHRLHGS